MKEGSFHNLILNFNDIRFASLFYCCKRKSATDYEIEIVIVNRFFNV